MEQQTVSSRIEEVQREVAACCSRCGRDPRTVTIMAVTKTQPVAAVRAAYDAGIRCFGENRVQEALQKYGDAALRLPDLDLHMIGHLQRNKARDAVALFSTVQSIDAVKTAEALQSWCRKSDTRMDVMMELNTSGEESKYGFTARAPLFECIDRVLQYDRLRLRGLMTIGPFTDDSGQIRTAFRTLAGTFGDVRDRYELQCFDVLSMGMSNDYPIAIEEGATMIRLGTVLFGPRS